MASLNWARWVSWRPFRSAGTYESLQRSSFTWPEAGRFQAQDASKAPARLACPEGSAFGSVGGRHGGIPHIRLCLGSTGALPPYGSIGWAFLTLPEDSHDDNIMLREDGFLFRVDFGALPLMPRSHGRLCLRCFSGPGRASHRGAQCRACGLG